MTRTRFAPSPTGLMHLGNARTALFNALLARRDSGQLILRIEDTDAARDDAAHEAALLEDLCWLGIEWQEGPDRGGPHAPYAQSGRQTVYTRYYRQLEQQDAVYPCFCSPQTLKLARKAQLAAGRPPRYPGTCAKLGKDEIERRLAAGERPTLRFRVIPGRLVEFDDLVRGPQQFKTDDIGDFIIRRTDGTPAFFFSNALDDALMGVTHALRGEDHLANTPRQLLLLEALNLPAPRYGHIALVMGEESGPLSKREGATSVRAFRDLGYLPGALVNYLARLGHHYADESYHDFDALARGFDTAHLGRAPAHFDLAQLNHWQREAVLRLGDAESRAWLEAALTRVPAAARHAFIQAVRPNVLFPGEADEWATIVFEAPAPLTAEARTVVKDAGAAFFNAALAAVEASGTDYAALTAHIKKVTGAKGRALFLPLRLALTGRDAGPELAQLLPLLGVEELRKRLTAASRL